MRVEDWNLLFPHVLLPRLQGIWHSSIELEGKGVWMQENPVGSDIVIEGRSYHVDRALGSGRIANVYLASPAAAGQPDATPIVLKVLRPEHRTNGSQVARIRDEFAILRRLHDGGARVPRAIHLDQAPADASLPFLAMELAPGETLRTLRTTIPSYRLPEPLALALAIPILDALRLVHAMGAGYTDWDLSDVYWDPGITIPPTSRDALATGRHPADPARVTVIDWNILTVDDLEDPALRERRDLRHFWTQWFTLLTGATPPSSPTLRGLLRDTQARGDLSEWLWRTMARGLTGSGHGVSTLLAEVRNATDHWFTPPALLLPTVRTLPGALDRLRIAAVGQASSRAGSGIPNSPTPFDDALAEAREEVDPSDVTRNWEQWIRAATDAIDLADPARALSALDEAGAVILPPDRKDDRQLAQHLWRCLASSLPDLPRPHGSHLTAVTGSLHALLDHENRADPAPFRLAAAALGNLKGDGLALLAEMLTLAALGREAIAEAKGDQPSRPSGDAFDQRLETFDTGDDEDFLGLYELLVSADLQAELAEAREASRVRAEVRSLSAEAMEITTRPTADPADEARIPSLLARCESLLPRVPANLEPEVTAIRRALDKWQADLKAERKRKQDTEDAERKNREEVAELASAVRNTLGSIRSVAPTASLPAGSFTPDDLRMLVTRFAQIRSADPVTFATLADDLSGTLATLHAPHWDHWTWELHRDLVIASLHAGIIDAPRASSLRGPRQALLDRASEEFRASASAFLASAPKDGDLLAPRPTGILLGVAEPLLSEGLALAASQVTGLDDLVTSLRTAIDRFKAASQAQRSRRATFEACVARNDTSAITALLDRCIEDGIAFADDPAQSPRALRDRYAPAPPLRLDLGNDTAILDAQRRVATRLGSLWPPLAGDAGPDSQADHLGGVKEWLTGEIAPMPQPSTDEAQVLRDLDTRFRSGPGKDDVTGIPRELARLHSAVAKATERAGLADWRDAVSILSGIVASRWFLACHPELTKCTLALQRQAIQNLNAWRHALFTNANGLGSAESFTRACVLHDELMGFLRVPLLARAETVTTGELDRIDERWSAVRDARQRATKTRDEIKTRFLGAKQFSGLPTAIQNLVNGLNWIKDPLIESYATDIKAELERNRDDAHGGKVINSQGTRSSTQTPASHLIEWLINGQSPTRDQTWRKDGQGRIREYQAFWRERYGDLPSWLVEYATLVIDGGR